MKKMKFLGYLKIYDTITFPCFFFSKILNFVIAKKNPVEITQKFHERRNCFKLSFQRELLKRYKQ